MRIAFLTPGFVTEEKISGGLVNYLYQTCLSLIKLGHQPIVITASKKNEVIFHNGIEVHRVKVKNYLLWFLDVITLRQFTRPLAYLYQSRKLNREALKAHRKKPFAVIQCASSLAVGLFRLKEVPTVVRMSSHPGLWRKARGKSYLHLDQRIAYGLEIKTAAKADGIFAPSQIIADIVRKETGKPVAVIETPVGADVPQTDDRLYRNLLAGRDYLLFFGSLDRRKGVDVIAETLFELLGKYPQLFFVFIGQDSRYQRGMMSDYLLHEAGFYREKVLCLERVPREKLYPVLDNALAIVLPSRLDNLPNACLEAMARRKVVVGTRGASFEQLIENGVSGFLCEPGDPTDLLKSIEKSLSLTPEQKRTVGEKAFQRVNANNPEKVTVQLVDFYQKFIAK